MYANAKKLPVEFLSGLGLSDCKRACKPAIRIPYRDASGLEMAVRYRHRMTKEAEDDRFSWNRGAKLLPYGLWRLHKAHEVGFVVLVEGESDSQTLWYHGLPALGVPGASTWNEAWSPFLDEVPVIYAVIEPGKSGKTFHDRLSASSIRERLRLIRLEGAKDPSELYLIDPERFVEAWQVAMETAAPLEDVERREAEARRRDAWERCASLATSPDILVRFEHAVERAGLVGESKAARLIYLVLITRFLDRPVCVVVKGPSSGGKNYLTLRVLDFFPLEAYHALTAMSERALAYSEEPVAHRFLVLYEAVSLNNGFAAFLARSLVSEGRVRYETVEKTSKGLRARLIEREGPTGLLVTTTSVHLDRELETRMLSVTVNDSKEQTRRVLEALATEDTEPLDLTEWHALQEWLATVDHAVAIPYAQVLARTIEPAAVRLRRDFATILALIRAHAVLHQANRQRNEQGRIIAILEDYAAVRELVCDSIDEEVEARVPETVRATVLAVEKPRGSGTTEPNVKAVAGVLGLDGSSAYRRVQRAIKAGFLVNLETGRGRPARLVLGDPLPVDNGILPTVDQLRHEFESRTVASEETTSTSCSVDGLDDSDHGRSFDANGTGSLEKGPSHISVADLVATGDWEVVSPFSDTGTAPPERES